MKGSGKILRDLLVSEEITVLMEAHNALAARICEQNGFPAIWVSWLCIACSIALRRNREATWTEVTMTTDWILEATRLPVLFDGDIWHGNHNNVRQMVCELGRRGFAGVVINDKVFSGPGCFVDDDPILLPIKKFQEKLRAAKDAQEVRDFLIIAGLEGFIAGQPVNFVVEQAHEYIEAGADALLIHSRQSDVVEIAKFLEQWQEQVPVIVSPTSYPNVTFAQLKTLGVSGVICVNQTIRAAASAIDRSTRPNLRVSTPAAANDEMAPLMEILDPLSRDKSSYYHSSSRRTLMLNPGPTNVHEDVRRALLAPDKNHRSAAFADTLKKVRNKIVQLLGLEATHTVIPLVASGTGANEAMLSRVAGPVIVPVAGRYSNRLADLAEHCGLKVIRVSCDPLHGVDIDILETAVRDHPEITHICLVHHETTTGVIVSLNAVVAISERYGVGIIADGISSVFGQELGSKAQALDYITLTSNKCLEAVPGLSFVIARRSLMEAATSTSHSYYLDLRRQWWHMETKNAPINTHGYAYYRAVEVALERLRAESVAGRCSRYRSLRDRLKIGMTSLSFTPLDAPPGLQANWLQLYRMPVGFDFTASQSRLADRGISIYTDDETLVQGNMYLATMGAIDASDVDRFLDELQADLSALRPTTSPPSLI